MLKFFQGWGKCWIISPRVQVNCTSSSSHPAPQLKWFINGKTVRPCTLHPAPCTAYTLSVGGRDLAERREWWEQWRERGGEEEGEEDLGDGG